MGARFQGKALWGILDHLQRELETGPKEAILWERDLGGLMLWRSL
jgi:hypothetical protein